MNVMISIFLVLLFLSGCNKHSVTVEYESLKKDGMSPKNLYEKIYDFEIMNPEHLEAKIDLASMNVLMKNYDRAKEYLERCKPLIDKSRNENAKCDYYGLSSAISFYERNYEKAREYLSKIGDSSHGKKFIFLKGHVFLNLGEYEKALKCFDEGFRDFKKRANNDDYVAYMSLLIETERFRDCLPVLNQYFLEGKYFYGFGRMASLVYEKNEMYFNAIISAYLDYDYANDFKIGEKNNLLKKITELKVRFASEKYEREINEAAQCIESILLEKKFFPEVDDNFPGTRYLKLKHNVLVGHKCTGNEGEFNGLKFFSEIPSYIYMLSDCSENKISVYEKLLDFGEKCVYSEYARENLSQLMGIEKNDSKKLLVHNEINFLLNDFITYGNKKSLEKVFETLDLPDNRYLFYAMMVIKENLENDSLRNSLVAEAEKCHGKRKERINYIVSR